MELSLRIVYLFYVGLFAILWTQTSCSIVDRINEDAARIRLAYHSAEIQRLRYDYYLGLWEYQTNITDHNKNIAATRRTRVSTALAEAADDLRGFLSIQFEDESLGRAVRLLVGDEREGDNNNDPEQVASNSAAVAALLGEMQRNYGTASVLNTVCENRSPGDPSCVLNEMGVRSAMSGMTDWEELAVVWKGWRDEAAKPNRQNYAEFVAARNRAAVYSGWSDHSEMMLHPYEVSDMEEQIERIWIQLKPLYRKIHAYVRRKMKAIYEPQGNMFPSSGHIPAHILGEKMGAHWIRYEELLPFQERPLGFTEQLVQQNYTGTSIYRLAEHFFRSLGLPAVEESFWEDSMLEEPTDGRRVICHANAWDFMLYGKARIKHCGTPDERTFQTAHHEMGHIYYFMAYRNLTYPFRTGANPGFHEAVGDTIGLSTSTPDYLADVGLLNNASPRDHDADINFLLKQSLTKVVFLPFALIMDKWRYQVYRGEITPQNYNREWWKLRCKYQGLYPPMLRDEEDFDAAALYHLPADIPYLRYFVSTVLQYQLHQGLCHAAGHTGPLHTCNIHQSTAAGSQLWNMMKLGASKPWPEALETLTGSRQMSADAILEYFQPLTDWLNENEAESPVWDEECPSGSFSPARPRALASTSGSYPVSLASKEQLFMILLFSLLTLF